MADGEANRTHVRVAAAIMAAIITAAAVITYLGYTAAFTATDTVTVTSPRAGLVMQQDAKVKYRGIQIGKVTDIAYDGDQAKLTLAIDRSQLPYVPANARVDIAGNTIFGAKSVEFTPPGSPEGAMKPGTTVRASDVQLEVNTLFQKLTDLLHKVDPVNLNATLSALGEGLRGNGDDLGAMMAGLNSYLEQLNPKLPTLQADFAQAATVADIYADAAPDLTRVFDNAPALSATIIDQEGNLNATLLAATGLGNNAYETLAPAAEDYIAAIQRLRAPTKLLGEYSPQFGCLLESLVTAADKFGPIIGGTRPGLFVSSNFLPGVPAYTYPESLPIVNATGGPNCRGLPDIPSKQSGGSWYRAPFLVTDNAYVPFQPNTEVQFDAPSTLQFLFNGAYAERDDF
ncbi:MCE family protein [[Mycobacterium] burgundiense]|uniref:MCE family protein n=1 Tax=[Mycobacterium] burgundiense TaxID=3064286 RepID=A0ABM9LAP7_9MYCO|nr:MCE family protein [Mycolicibacterium sp. MU0053]CAJ1495768.1 MCE family protein [Mycolicibacterium sp. MU0053]